MKTLPSIFRALSVAAALLALSAGPAHAEKWDMPMAYGDGNYHTRLGKAFADAVREATQGELDIVVHGGGSLFGGGDIKRAVQTGQAPIGERLLSAHQNENALFGTDSVPFLATNFDEAEALWNNARPELEKILDGQGLVLLYSVPWPPQGLYFNKAVNNLADAKGIKFRTYNTAGQQMAKLMGMVPVQIEAAELVQALATGVADGFVSSGATGYDRKVWEHQSHYYIVNAWAPRNYVFVNKDAWNKLDKKTQATVRAIARMTERAGVNEAKYLTNWYYDQLRAQGMTVVEAGPELKASLVDIGEKMRAEWLKSAGAQGEAVIKAYRASL